MVNDSALAFILHLVWPTVDDHRGWQKKEGRGIGGTQIGLCLLQKKILLDLILAQVAEFWNHLLYIHCESNCTVSRFVNLAVLSRGTGRYFL